VIQDRSMNNLPSRALIVQQPWIGLILEGMKTWEMRNRPTNIRGQIALIEAGTGLIAGETEIIDSHDYPIHYATIDYYYDKHRIDDHALLEKWRYPWVMKNSMRYEKPIPYNHPSGAVVWVDLTKPGVVGDGNQD